MVSLIHFPLVLWALTFTPQWRGVYAINCTCVTVGGKVISADCSYLGWTEVPRGLPSTLQTLNMSGNLLSSVPSSAFVRYPLLEILDLSENRINKLDNQSFGGLLGLDWLSLRNNLLPYFPGTFPDDVFRQLPGLSYLDLQNQTFIISPEMSYPDVAVSSLTSLKTLRMDGLGNNVDLGPGFAGLWRLKVLDISDETGHCSFTELSEWFFASINTSSPLTLNLTGCQLRKIHKNTFSFLPTLRSLDLYDCRSFPLPAFMEATKSLRWTQIKVLNISYTHRGVNIKIEAEYFKYLGYTSLKYFIVDGMEAYDVDLRAMFNLPTSLKYLSFFDNKLINATFLYGLFLLPHLETIQVSRQNHFTSTSKQQDTGNFSDVHKQTMLSERTGSARGTGDVKVRKGSGSTLYWNKSHFPYNQSNKTIVSSTLSAPAHVQNVSKRQAVRYKADDYHTFDTMDILSKQNKAGTGNGLLNNEQRIAGVDFRHSFKSKQSSHERMLAGKKVSSISTQRPARKLVSMNKNRGHLLEDKVMTRETRAARFTVDPSICLDSEFMKTDKERLNKFLHGLKSFLRKNHLHFFKRTSNVTKKNVMNDSKVSGDILHGKRAGLLSNFQDDYVPLPPTVKFAYGSDIHLGYVLPRFQFFNNSLEVLDLSNNRMPCFIGPWLGLHNLRRFDLSKNFAVYLNPDFFQDMSGLTHLFLQRNFIGDSLASDHEGRSFRGMQNLEVLNLADNYIKRLSKSAFQAQGKLKTLSLARNAMSRFKPRVGHMTSLTFMDLSDNNFGYLERELMEDLDTISQWSKNLTVDMYLNPLSCGCEALNFWYWVTRKTEVRLHRISEYTCTLSNGSEIDFSSLEQEIDFLWLQCHGLHFLNVAIAMMATLLVLLTILGVLHYKRWHLRYFYYVGLSRYRHPYDCHQRQDDRQGQGNRDVFISFDDDDPRVRLFVQNVLRPELDRRGLSYYITEIDFPGHPIKDIIPKVVLGAKKTLALFSSHFFPSYERELEFNMAVYHEEEIHRQVIVPLLLESVDWSQFPPEVLVYLEEHSFIPYCHGDANFVQMLIDRIEAVVRF